MSKKSEWFDDWFNSPYYHILYKNRDYQEASAFLDQLIAYLQLCPEDKILDLACGKGRHSIYLNKKGFDVTGIDLSASNIAAAKAYENEHLHFSEHDMREPFRTEAFDYVLNMFTSFGYFKSEKENQQAINCVAECLKPEGQFVLDFLNPYVVINDLVPKEVKELEGIQFHICRAFEDGYIVKKIDFQDQGKDYHFEERVMAIRRIEFLDYFRQAGLRLVDTFGDYKLNPYVPESSERMIFIVKK